MILRNRSIAVGEFALLGLEDRRGLEPAVGRRLAGGELAGEGLPGGDGAVELLLLLEAVADFEEDAGHAFVERVLRRRTRTRPARASAKWPRCRWSAAIRSWVSRIARWASAPCGPLGNRAR